MFFGKGTKEKLSYGFRKTTIGIGSFLLGSFIFLAPDQSLAQVSNIKAGTNEAIVVEGVKGQKDYYTNNIPEFNYNKKSNRLTDDSIDPVNMKSVTIEEVTSDIAGTYKYKIGLNVGNDFGKLTGSYTSNPYLGFVVSRGFEVEKVVMEYNIELIGFTGNTENPLETDKIIIDFNKNNIKSKIAEINSNYDKRFTPLRKDGTIYEYDKTVNPYINYFLQAVAKNTTNTGTKEINENLSILLSEFKYVDSNFTEREARDYINPLDFAKNYSKGPQLEHYTKSEDGVFHWLKDDVNNDVLSSVFVVKEESYWGGGQRGDKPVYLYVYLKSKLENKAQFDKERYIGAYLKSYDNSTQYRRMAMSIQTITTAEAKLQAINYVNGLKYLTTVQKNRIITNINSVNVDTGRINGVYKDGSIQDYMYRAQIQDTQMKQLTELVKKYEPVIKYGKYRNADSDKKLKFDSALELARNVLNGNVDKWEGYSTDKSSIGYVAEELDRAYEALNGHELKVTSNPVVEKINIDSDGIILSNIDSNATQLKLFYSNSNLSNQTLTQLEKNGNINNILTLKKDVNGEWSVDGNSLLTVSKLNNGKLKIKPLNNDVSDKLEDKYIILAARNAEYSREYTNMVDDGKSSTSIVYDTKLSKPVIEHGSEPNEIVIKNIDSDVSNVRIVQRKDTGEVEILYTFFKNEKGYSNPGNNVFEERYENGILTLKVIDKNAISILNNKTLYSRVEDKVNNVKVSDTKILFETINKPVVKSAYIDENIVTVSLPMSNEIGDVKIGDTVVVKLDNDQNTLYTAVLNAQNLADKKIDITVTGALKKGQKVVAEIRRNETKVSSDEYVVNEVNPSILEGLKNQLNQSLNSALDAIIKKARGNFDSLTDTNINNLVNDVDSKLVNIKAKYPLEDLSSYENSINAYKKINEITNLTDIEAKENRKSEIETLNNKVVDKGIKDKLNKGLNAVVDTISVNKLVNETLKEFENNLFSQPKVTAKLDELRNKTVSLLNNYPENNELSYNKLSENLENHKQKENNKTILLYKKGIDEVIDAINSIKNYQESNDANIDKSKLTEATLKIKEIDNSNEYKLKLTELLKDVKAAKEVKYKIDEAKKLKEEIEREIASTRVFNTSNLTPLTEKNNRYNEIRNEIPSLIDKVKDSTEKSRLNEEYAKLTAITLPSINDANNDGKLDKSETPNSDKAKLSLEELKKAKEAVEAKKTSAKQDSLITPEESLEIDELIKTYNAKKELAKEEISKLEESNEKDELNKTLSTYTELKGLAENKTLKEELEKAKLELSKPNYTEATSSLKTNFDNEIAKTETILKNLDASKDELNKQLLALQKAQNDLDGRIRLSQAKYKAFQKLATLKNLNDAQRKDITDKINNYNTISNVELEISNATKLDTKMGELKTSIDKDTSTKTSPDYINATNKNAYDLALEEAKNKFSNSLSISEITDVLKKLEDTRKALDGSAELNKAKQDAISKVNALDSLNNKQKEAAIAEINSKNNKDDIQPIVQKATELNQAMKDLETLKTSEKDLTTGTQNLNDYKSATDSKKQDYDTALKNVEALLEKTTGENLDINKVNEIKQNLITAKNNLDGDERLQEAKKNLPDMTSLNENQRNDATTKLNNAQTLKEFEDEKNRIQKLNEAMKSLRDEITKNTETNDVKKLPKYINATNKNVYDDALKLANDLISSTGENSNLEKVNEVKNNYLSSISSLNGDTNLSNAKSSLIKEINALTNINQAQKDKLIEKVNSVEDSSNLDKIRTEAIELDNKMGELDKLTKSLDSYKTNQDYIDATQTPNKDEFNTELETAKKLKDSLENKGAYKTKEEVEKIIANLNAKKEALDGIENLKKAKEEAKISDELLGNLNSKQKETQKSILESATSLSDLSSKKEEIKKLNQKMGELKTTISNENNTKDTVDYKNSSELVKKEYDLAIDEAKKIITETVTEKENLKSISEIQSKIDAIKTAKSKFDATTNLAKEKELACKKIDELTNLNDLQKQTIKNNINNDLSLVSQINDKVEEAKKLDVLMGELKKLVTDNEKTNTTSNYTNSDEAKKNAFNTAMENAKKITPTTGENATNDIVSNRITELKNAISALDGDTELKNYKESKIREVEDKNYLNKNQKEHLKNLINSSPSKNNVDEIMNNTVNPLDNKMKELSELKDSEINSSNGTKTTQDYYDATNKKDYDDSIDKIVKVVDKENGENKNIAELTEMINSLTKSKEALNGYETLTSMKAKITYDNLNEAQKNYYQEKVNSAKDIDSLNKVVEDLEKVKSAMGELRNVESQANLAKQTFNYKEASETPKTNFDQKLELVNNVTKNGSTENLVLDKINEYKTNLSSAISALDGNEKIREAREKAINDVKALNNINTTQKNLILGKLEANSDGNYEINSVSEIEKISNSAKLLDNSMNNLKLEVEKDKNYILDQDYYDTSSEDLKNKYTTAFDEAKDLSLTGAELNPDKVNEKLENLKQAKDNLTGKDELISKKADVKKAVDTYSKLNEKQKEKGKLAVENAKDKAEVNAKLDEIVNQNKKMEELFNLLEQEKETKKTAVYELATQSKKEEYNKKIKEATDLLSSTTDARTTSEIDKLISEIKTLKNNLDGDKGVKPDNQYLNDSQRERLDNEYDKAVTATELSAVKEKISKLNTLMKEIRERMEKDSDISNSVRYINADETYKTRYNKALTKLETITTDVPALDATYENAESIYAAYKLAYNDLNGETKLEESRKSSNTVIDGLTNLNDKQKEEIKNKISNAKTDDEISKIIEEAKKLDEAMKKLKDTILDAEKTKETPKYTEATNKEEFDNKLNEAEKIVDSTKDTTDNITIDNVNKLIKDLTDSKDALNGETVVNEYKKTAKETIDKLGNLNDKQKEILKSKLEDSKVDTKSKVDEIVNEAKELDSVMKDLKDLLNSEDGTKDTIQYTQSSDDKKKAYDEAIKSGQDLVDKVLNDTDNKNKDEVSSIIDKIKVTKSELNGNKEVSSKKDELIKKIPNMSNLNYAQKNTAIGKINSATTKEELSSLDKSISELNEKMGQLIEKVKTEKLRDKDNDYKYYNSSKDLLDKYNNSITNAEKVIDTNSTIDADITKVEELINAINYDSLDGKLTDLKELEKLVNQSSENKEKHIYYNLPEDKQKEYDQAIEKAKELLNKANSGIVTQKEVDTLVKNIKEIVLDGAETNSEELRNLVNNYESSKLKPAYYNDVETKKTEYDKAIEEANELLEKQISGDKVTQKDVDNMVEKVKLALENLNGVETNKSGLKKLIDDANSKKNSGAYINEQNKLTKDLFDKALEEAIEIYSKENATNNDVVEAQTRLNKAIESLTGLETNLEELKKLVDESETVKKSLNYTTETNENKKNYDNSIEEAKKILEKGSLASQKEVDEIVAKIEKAKSNLNGSKNRIDNIVDATEREKKDSNYINADQDKKDAVDKALEKLKDIISNPNSTDEEIKKAIEELENALKALNGDLNKYKDQASKFIYEDYSIADRFNDDFFLNITLGNSITNMIEKMLVDKSFDLHNLIGGIQLGLNKKVTDVLNTRVGGFIEYMNTSVQNISLGVNVKTDYLTSFVRYRLAVLPEIKNSINHNIDIFLKGNYKAKINDIFAIDTGLTSYLTYSSKTLLEKVYIKPRLGAKIELTSKFAYEQDGLYAYVMPGLNYSYSTQVLVDKNQNELIIPRNNELNYRLVTGVGKKFENGINVGGDLTFNGSLTHLYDKSKHSLYSFRVDTYLGYNW